MNLPNPQLFDGERATTPTELCRKLAGLGANVAGIADLSDDAARSLHTASAGWVLPALAVVQGAYQLGVDLNAVTENDLPDLLSVDTLLTISETFVDDPSMRLAYLGSYLHILSYDTLKVAVAAIAEIGRQSPTLPSYNADMIDQLAEVGAIVKTENAHPGTFTQPVIIRAIVRHMFERKSFGFSKKKTKRILAQVFIRAVQTAPSNDVPSRTEAILQGADSNMWDFLSRQWSTIGIFLFTAQPVTVARAYIAIPAGQVIASPLLAEAHGIATQITNLAVQKGGEVDRSEIFSTIDYNRPFAHILDMKTELDRHPAYTADDIVALSNSTLHSYSRLGNLSAGLREAEIGWHEAQKRGVPSRRSDARFNLQRGIFALSIGYDEEAIRHFKRATISAEMLGTAIPSVLAASYIYTALARISHGNGRTVDEAIRRYENISQQFPIYTASYNNTYHLSVLLRSMDSLDLPTAENVAELLPDTTEISTEWATMTIQIVMLGIVTSNTNLLEKKVQLALASFVEELDDESRPTRMLLPVRIYIYLAKGEAHSAQSLALGALTNRPNLIVAKSYLQLCLGEYASATDTATLIQPSSRMSRRALASARTVQAASALKLGDLGRSRGLFQDALEYCVVSSTLVPIALLPAPIRAELIQLTADEPLWDTIASTFSLENLSGADIRRRLLELGETLRESLDTIQLRRNDIDLLLLIESWMSLDDIAQRTGQAKGTVKNKLSRLYRRLGVRNRREAITYALNHGYLSQAQQRD